MKEFKQRWYLVASKVGESNIRTFGLDRILSIETQKAKFDIKNFSLHDLFKDFYGIINDNDAKLEEVVLSFESFQGNYIKSLPLHHSQEIIEDNEDELVINLKLHITFDFIQKLLSYGKYLKVISPNTLKDKIRTELQDAIEQYK